MTYSISRPRRHPFERKSTIKLEVDDQHEVIFQNVGMFLFLTAIFCIGKSAKFTKNILSNIT